MSQATTGDRRDVAAPRVQYEALVEVGAGANGGFEAESIDVSPDGIRLRTAHLPRLGERLVCRFDGFGGEIVAHGEVIWRREQGRGGELGVRFVGLDERGAKLLEAMCQPPQPAEPDAEPQQPMPHSALPGSRVKLHIQGLGSPMRARVRDAARGEVLVGSSLEFLRVGRDVELEDVEQGGRRVALIEHVGVEIDSGTQVPQLVVALRYEGGAAADEEPARAEEHATAPYRLQAMQKKSNGKNPAAQPSARRGGAGGEITPEPTVIDDDDDPSAGRAALPPAAAVSAAGRAGVGGGPAGDDSAPDATGHRIGAIARGIGPTIASAGGNAKTALSSVLAFVRKKREQRKLDKAREKATVKPPKRTTAPPPSGALRSDGKRLFREPQEEPMHHDDPDMESPRRNTKREAIAVAVIGAVAVVAIYAGAMQLTKPHPPSASPVAAAAEQPSAAATAEPGAPIATAQVPLFGATPLSTTEPVPAPPSPEALDEDEDGGDAAPAGDKPAAALTKSWGVGKVDDPVTLKLNMDGKIAGFTGTDEASGFTIVVPGRRSLSTAAGLARKDKRLKPIKPVNYPDRVEVAVRFKGEVPAYAVKAKGKQLFIDLDGKKAKKGAGSKKKKNDKGSDDKLTHDGDDKNKKPSTPAKKGDRKKAKKSKKKA